MARRNTLIAALLLAVLLGHTLVLQWLAWQTLEQSGLRQMAAPMFTRMLQPKVAQPVPVRLAQAASVRPPRKPNVIESVAPSTPAQSTPTALPEPAASEPAAATPSAVVTPAQDVAAADSSPSSATGTSTATSAEMPGAAPLDSWPADTRLSYRVSGQFRGELHGNARVEWLRDGERYQTRIDIDLGLVSLVMTSQGLVSQKELTPLAYEESRAGKRRAVLLQDKIVLADGRPVPRPEGVQDTASQFVQLSHGFASGQLPLEVGRSVSFWMARPGGVDFWTYDVTDKEILQTPQYGAVEAFHLKPRPTDNPRGNITAEMWFAPSLQFLPVRIRVLAGEAHLDLLIEKIEQR